MLFKPGAGASDAPRFFTYGNPRNSFTADTMLPGRIDYIFYMSRPGVSIRASRWGELASKMFQLPNPS